MNGRTSGWFRGVQTRHEGHIRAGGVDKEVTFVEETDPEISKQTDAAYRAKYECYPSSVDHINSPKARTATIKLLPRSSNSLFNNRLVLENSTQRGMVTHTMNPRLSCEAPNLEVLAALYGVQA